MYSREIHQTTALFTVSLRKEQRYTSLLLPLYRDITPAQGNGFVIVSIRSKITGLIPGKVLFKRSLHMDLIPKP